MTMSMQHLVQEYLDERRGLGCALTIPGSQLLAFARFAEASGHRSPLTRQLITCWARDEAKRATPLIDAFAGTSHRRNSTQTPH